MLNGFWDLLKNISVALIIMLLAPISYAGEFNNVTLLGKTDQYIPILDIYLPLNGYVPLPDLQFTSANPKLLNSLKYVFAFEYSTPLGGNVVLKGVRSYLVVLALIITGIIWWWRKIHA